VVPQFKAWVCVRSLAGILGSNPAGGMNVCLWRMLCVVRYRSLRRAYHSSREVAPSVCVCVCVTECYQIQKNPYNTTQWVGSRIRLRKEQSIWKITRLLSMHFTLIPFYFLPLRPIRFPDHLTVNPLTPELNPSAQRCLTKFFTGDFSSWTVNFVNICVKNQHMHQLFIWFINYAW
jgi:hypothetical protein